jgi:hypothetical protein
VAVFMGLFTSSPDDSYTAATPTGNEISASSYGRQVIVFTAPAGSPRQVTNSNQIVFPAAFPEAWGVLTHFGIFDAPKAGNLLYWASLPNKAVGSTEISQFQPGTITLSED